MASSQPTDSLPLIRLGIEDGLPDAKITGIAQDGDGFLWVGTSNGLSRYDGTEFRNFFHHKNTNSLPGNNIIRIINYDPNHLLIATGTGLSLLNTRTLEFKNFVVNSSALMFSRDNFIMSMAIDSNKNIWAGTRTTLYCLNPELKIIKTFKGYREQDYNRLRMLYAYDICVLPGNELLLLLEEKETSHTDYYIYNTHADTLQPLQQLTGHPLHLLSRINCSYISTDSKGNVHFLKLLSDSLCTYDIHTRQIRYTRLLFTNHASLRELNAPLFRVLNAGPQSLLCRLVTPGGFVQLPPSYPSEKWRTITLPVYLKGEMINAAKQDRDGNLWVGGNNGLYTSITRSTNIQSNPVNPPKPPALFLSHIKFINDAIWVSSDLAGFFTFNKQCKPLENIVLKGDSLLATAWFPIPGPAPDTLWLSTQKGIRWYHTRTKSYGTLNMKGKPPVMDERPVTASFTDSKGLLWLGIGFGNGLVQYNPVNRSMTHYVTSGSSNNIPIRYPLAIVEDFEGNLWMGNHDGVGIARWRRKDNRFDMITPDYYSTFDNANITGLLCNRSVYLWVTTFNGLFRYHIPTNQVTKYDVSNGLPSNALNSITADDKGRIWIGTSNGLSCFYPNENRFVNFMHPNALPETGINDLAWDSSTKKIYFITNHYINAFDPDELLGKHPVLTINITGVRIGNKEKVMQNDYTLPYNQNDISISFTAINFANGPLNKYYYQLAGKDWISLGNQRQVNFLN
jgi:ligand-binding sensor domain-containing protein